MAPIVNIVTPIRFIAVKRNTNLIQPFTYIVILIHIRYIYYLHIIYYIIIFKMYIVY